MRRHVHVVLALVLAACSDLVEPTLGVCGNRIVESGEDCDDPSDPRCGAATLAVGCRLLCAAEATEPACPPGRGCGSDGVCRSPEEQFASVPIHIDEPGARWIRVGDLDGDLRDDLVMQFVEPDGRDVKAIHVDPEHAVEVIQLLEPAIAVGDVGDLTSDGLADVLLVREQPPETIDSVQLSLWRGTVDDVPAHFDFATLRTEGTGARLLAAGSEHDRVLELVDADTTRRWSSDRSSAITIDAIGVSGPTLGASIAIADIDGGECEPTSDGFALPRNEVALATIGSTKVQIGSTCGAGTPFEIVANVAVPAARGLGGAGAFFVLADPGGALDLVTQDADGAVWIAWGVGDGSFDAAPDVPATGGDGRFALLSNPPEGLGDLLAVYDFDRDGSLDLVLAGGYVPDAATCSRDACMHWKWPEGSELEFAATVDINADGVVDMAALADDFLWLFLADPLREVPFEARSVEQVGDVRELAVGDFDHDTLSDVAIAVYEEDAPPAADETIAILYGGDVAAWRVEILGPFAHVETLVVDGGDTIVARLLDEGGSPAGAFLRPGVAEYDFGVALRAPTLLRTASGVVAAAIAGTPDGDVLAHLGFVAGALSPHDVILGDPLGFASFHAVMAPIDLDGDALDELLVLGPPGVRVAVLDEERWRFVTAFEIGVGFAAVPVDAIELAPSYPPPGGGPGTTIVVDDVDGDGDTDALATTDEVPPRLAVMLNDAGSLSAAATELLPSPQFEAARLSRWHPDLDGGPRFLVGGVDGVAILRMRDSAVELTPVSELAVDALATADLDGDGLLDLVLGARDETVVHLAVDAIQE